MAAALAVSVFQFPPSISLFIYCDPSKTRPRNAFPRSRPVPLSGALHLSIRIRVPVHATLIQFSACATFKLDFLPSTFKNRPSLLRLLLSRFLLRPLNHLGDGKTMDIVPQRRGFKQLRNRRARKYSESKRLQATNFLQVRKRTKQGDSRCTMKFAKGTHYGFCHNIFDAPG